MPALVADGGLGAKGLADFPLHDPAMRLRFSTSRGLMTPPKSFEKVISARPSTVRFVGVDPTSLQCGNPIGKAEGGPSYHRIRHVEGFCGSFRRQLKAPPWYVPPSYIPTERPVLPINDNGRRGIDTEFIGGLQPHARRSAFPAPRPPLSTAFTLSIAAGSSTLDPPCRRRNRSPLFSHAAAGGSAGTGGPSRVVARPGRRARRGLCP